MRVAWDRERYRPGDSALLTLTALTPGMTLRTAVRQGTQPASPLAIDDRGLARVEFTERGEWQVQVFNGTEEIYTKTQVVSPGLGEGNHIEVDDATLRSAALACGGEYAREGDAQAVFAHVAEKLFGRHERHERGLLDGWWTVVMITVLMIGELVLRRTRNWL